MEQRFKKLLCIVIIGYLSPEMSLELFASGYMMNPVSSFFFIFGHFEVWMFHNEPMWRLTALVNVTLLLTLNVIFVLFDWYVFLFKTWCSLVFKYRVMKKIFIYIIYKHLDFFHNICRKFFVYILHFSYHKPWLKVC